MLSKSNHCTNVGYNISMIPAQYLNAFIFFLFKTLRHVKSIRTLEYSTYFNVILFKKGHIISNKPKVANSFKVSNALATVSIMIVFWIQTSNKCSW